MTSVCDKEVEKYFVKCQQTTAKMCDTERSPSKLATKRPATAFSFFPSEPTTPKKCYTEKSLVKAPRTCHSLRKKTPSKLKTPTKTPTESDRFIPPRGSMNFSSSHYKIMKGWSTSKNQSPNGKSEESTKHNYSNVMSENINRVLKECNTPRILQYSSKATPSKSCASSAMKSYASTPSPSKIARKISKVSEKILDAPNYIDDYYLNLLHWSLSVDLIAVALDDSLYVWNPSTGDIDCLCTTETPQNYISSVQWIQDGAKLGVGISDGNVQLWDVDKKKLLRTMSGHASRVSTLSWNYHILTSGERSGHIHNHDVRVAEHCVKKLSLHSQEVCGLQWSPSGRFLASGANDNRVAIWDWNQVRDSNTDDEVTSPVHMFSEHIAAVKALAWCPWQQYLLASGGGVADKCIRFWNINTGSCLNSVETGSQVSSLIWNENYKELLSGHGYPNNQLTIWSYPLMNKKVDLLGHTGRVLQTTRSPDGTRVMSSAGDETLRMWNCFELSKERLKERNCSAKKVSRNLLTPTIR